MIQCPMPTRSWKKVPVSTVRYLEPTVPYPYITKNPVQSKSTLNVELTLMTKRKVKGFDLAFLRRPFRVLSQLQVMSAE
jgi:hypothetical protein